MKGLNTHLNKENGKIKVDIVKHETVELSKKEMEKVTIKTICMLFDIPFINCQVNSCGELYVWVKLGEGSGWDRLIRKATRDDKRAVRIIQEVKTRFAKMYHE